MKSLIKHFNRDIKITLMTVLLSLFCSYGFSQMSGDTYTIDPDGGGFPNFKSFQEAIDSLMSPTMGVGGPVIINIADGIYNGRYIIGAIANVSATDTIVFQSASDDSNKVILIDNFYNDSGINYLIKIDGADYVTFKSLTFNASTGPYEYMGRAIYFGDPESHHIKFLNCSFIGKSTQSSYEYNTLVMSEYDYNDYIEFRNCLFTNGEKAIMMSGNSTSNLNDGMIIENCIFNNQIEHCLYLRNFLAPVINGNEFTMTNDAGKAIYLYYVDWNYKLTNNKISIYNASDAIHIHYCDGASGLEGLIANNFVSLELANTSPDYGNGIRIENSTYQKVYFNSVSVFYSWKETSHSFYQHNGGSNIDVRNNIFFNSSGGYAFYSGNSGSTTSDYNNYYTIGKYLAYRDASNTDLASLQAVDGTKDQNSISVHPVFSSGTDLHTTTFLISDKGDPATAITTLVPKDIDGEDRTPGSPDIGADEFTSTTGTALSGTISIGPGQTYTTISSAVSELNKYGISSSVVFNILDDGSPYNERFTILPVTGADASNTVTFQPDPSNVLEVIISYNASSTMETVNLFKTSYITIKNMTISAINSSYPDVIRFSGYSHHDSIVGCTINSIGSTDGHYAVSSTNSFIHDISIIGNIIYNGRNGIYFSGATNNRFTNIVISDNRIENAFSNGIYLDNCDAPVIKENFINSGSTGYYYRGIYLDNCRFNYTITGNTINNACGDVGIYTDNSDGSQDFEGLVANNFISIEGNGSGLEDNGIYTDNTDYINIYFNSVRIDGSNTLTSADAYKNNGGSVVNVINNVLCNFGPGRAYYANNSTAVDNSDYNCFFAAGKYIAYYNSTNFPKMNEFQSASTKDIHSLVVYPAFAGSDNLHMNSPFLDAKGVKITGFTTDIDGDIRQDPPDIGADEFSATRTTISAGTYTIGGSSPDYATINEAVDSLQVRGISGQVTFNIRNGEFNEFIGNIYEIPGANAADTIVFKSESGNPDDVRIKYSTTSGQGSMFRLIGVDHFTIQDLTISATGTSAGQPIRIDRTINNINIINNQLVSANTSWHNLIIDDCITDDVTIKDNVFIGGSFGIHFNGDQNRRSTNTYIIGNNVSGASNMGIQLIYQDAPVVINNTVKNITASYYEGIRLSYCYADLVVSGNYVTSNNSQNGIILDNCDAVFPSYGLMTNNMVQLGGTYYATGLYLNNCDRMNLYHNSVHITSTYNNSYAIYIENNNNEIEIINNVFANSGNGRAMYIEEVIDIANSDYNDFYSVAADRFIRWGSTDYLDLASYKTASSPKDAHSISVDPLFYSTTDLHSEQVALFQAATPIDDVPVDIDSVARTPGNPDIGAYEFTCGTPEWNVVVSPTCLGDTTTFIDLSTNIARGSTYSWDFDGDYEPDLITKKANDTVMFYFDAAGDYTTYLQVIQIAGCNDFTTIDLSLNDLPSLEITTKGAYCGKDDGEASVEVTGGTAPYDYFWSTGETDTAITGLALGTYTLAVSDANGCTKTEEFTIGDAMQVTVTQLKTSTCGIPDGSAVVTATGGYEPYSYVWSNGETSDTNKTLSTGKHYVNVIDDSLCYAQGYVNIESDGSGPQVTLEDVTNNLCYGNKIGAIDISVSGGVVPYSILWSNGATTEDINNLAAGIYDVLVTDADGCMGAGSFEVTQASRITISTVVEDASCAGSDGKAVAVVSGGTKPYAYMWSSGGIYQIEEGLAAGVYSITVTDGRGCQEVKPVIVNNVGGPIVTIDNITGASCSNPNDGAIDISVSGGSPPYTSYSWTPGGQVTPDISGLSPGSYVVRVTDQEDCVGVNTAEVKQAVPDVNPICLVTVDTLTRKNMVVWEKLNTTDVDYYVIYRETNLKGIYQPIGIRPVDSLSFYIDSVADPTIRSWRYKLSVVDVCGVESELSEHHKTMHLTINIGLDDKINLIWDHYEGFDVSTYDVWRYSASGGWEKIQSMPANLTSYTDDNPPLDDLTYYIEVLHPTGCTTTKAGTLNSSKSNRQSRLKGTGMPDVFLNKYNLSIYPNPGPGLFNLSMDNLSSENVTVKVYDISGKLMYIKEFNHLSNRFETVLDLSGFADGIYHVQLRTNNALFHRVLIKE